MKRLAFTLMEVLAVSGILLLLSLIGAPIISNAKRSAKQSSCESNLRRLHLAVSLYRQEWEGDGLYGDANSMGLPPLPPIGKIPELTKLRCSEANNELFTPQGVHYYTFWIDPQLDGLAPSWKNYTEEFKERSILIADMNHNLKGVPLVEGNFLKRFGFGVQEGGNLVKRRKRGDWLVRTWWNLD